MISYDLNKKQSISSTKKKEVRTYQSQMVDNNRKE